MTAAQVRDGQDPVVIGAGLGRCWNVDRLADKS